MAAMFPPGLATAPMGLGCPTTTRHIQMACMAVGTVVGMVAGRDTPPIPNTRAMDTDPPRLMAQAASLAEGIVWEAERAARAAATSKMGGSDPSAMVWTAVGGGPLTGVVVDMEPLIMTPTACPPLQPAMVGTEGRGGESLPHLRLHHTATITRGLGRGTTTRATTALAGILVSGVGATTHSRGHIMTPWPVVLIPGALMGPNSVEAALWTHILSGAGTSCTPTLPKPCRRRPPIRPAPRNTRSMGRMTRAAWQGATMAWARHSLQLRWPLAM
mmetsp:Transcript_38196/g.77952  ORF Transcript_38196/g.77952 Transcript_38196/m.77952 type:complete len:273 (-) Transcript_38196:288-1106(-)